MISVIIYPLEAHVKIEETGRHYHLFSFLSQVAV